VPTGVSEDMGPAPPVPVVVVTGAVLDGSAVGGVVPGPPVVPGGSTTGLTVSPGDVTVPGATVGVGSGPCVVLAGGAPVFVGVAGTVVLGAPSDGATPTPGAGRDPPGPVVLPLAASEASPGSGDSSAAHADSATTERATMDSATLDRATTELPFGFDRGDDTYEQTRNDDMRLQGTS
jgi:hypothetical protein